MTRVRVPAKVNLVLEVLGPRPDGFHDVATILQAVGLYDDLSLQDADHFSLTVGGMAVHGPNLVEAAATLLARECGIVPRVRVMLTKRIPVAAGLGGGSADAMAMLVALDRHLGAGLGREQLLELGTRLGSDVPFFLDGGTQRATGRGEVLAALPACKGSATVLVPPGSVPAKTALAYRALGAAANWDDGGRTAGFRCGGSWYNRFDTAAGQLYPAASAVLGQLRAAGCPAVLCGAGPSILVAGAPPSGSVPEGWLQFLVPFVPGGVELLE